MKHAENLELCGGREINDDMLPDTVTANLQSKLGLKRS